MGELTYVHSGAFSGSAPSLRRALEARVQVDAVDLMPLARHPALIPARLRAQHEAAGAGDGVPWTKTAAWSAAVQRRLLRTGRLSPDVPLLVVQSLPALDLDGMTYAVYTDRVGREGAAVGGIHASRFSQGWLARETAFLRGASHVFVMGPSTADVLVKEYGVTCDRISVVGAGPNTTLSPARPRRRARRLLFVGTQWTLKGGPELLQAYDIIRPHHPDLELAIVGSAPKDMLPPGVTVLGRIPHQAMDAVYDDADVLVIPTHMEAFGIALVEALMKGVPCVGSIIGNQPWIIGDAGLTVPPGDVSALVDALNIVLDDYPRFHHRALTRGSELRMSMTWPRVADLIIDELGCG